MLPEVVVNNLPSNIEQRLDKSAGCWVFRGAKNADGYGQVRFQGATRLVHRVVYTLLVGPIEENLTLDHLCRVRACCNPDHLEPVTRRVNILRGNTFQAKHAAQTHCLRGHAFLPENTYIERSGSRRCVTCRRERNRNRRRPANTQPA